MKPPKCGVARKAALALSPFAIGELMDKFDAAQVLLKARDTDITAYAVTVTELYDMLLKADMQKITDMKLISDNLRTAGELSCQPGPVRAAGMSIIPALKQVVLADIMELVL